MINAFYPENADKIAFESASPPRFRLATLVVKTLLLTLSLTIGTTLSAQVDFCPLLPTGSYNAGDQITVPVNTSGITDIVGMQALFAYDPSLLQFESGTSVEASSSIASTTPGEVRFVYLYELPDFQGVTYPDGTIFVELTFTILAPQDDPQIVLSANAPTLNFEVLNADNNSEMLSICGVVVPDPGGGNTLQTMLEACVRQINEPAANGDVVSFPVWLTGSFKMVAFTFQVNYDANLYAFNGFTPGADIDNVTVDATTTGQLNFSWTGTEPFNSSGVELGSLDFSALTDIETPNIAVNEDPTTSSFLFENGNSGAVGGCLNTAFDPHGVVDFCPIIPEGSFAAGSVIDIPIHVSNFNGIGWISLPLTFDTSAFEFLEINAINTNPNIGFTWNTNDTTVTIIGLEWTGNGYSLPDGERLLTLRLIARQDVDAVDISLANGEDFFVANNFAISIVGEASFCNQLYVGNLPANAIASILLDTSNNCTPAQHQEELTGWTITYVDDATGDAFSALTGVNGNAYLALPVGTYSYSWAAPTENDIWDICPGGSLIISDPEQVQYIEGTTGISAECSKLAVSLSSFNLRPCFTNNRFRIRYNNFGTQMAENAFVDVAFDPAFVPLFASIAYTELGSDIYRFELGDLPINAQGSIMIIGQVDCDFPVGAAVCAEATIYPFRTICTNVDPDFLGGDVRVTSNCDGDSVRFLIENIGDGPTGPINFTVIEDVIIYMDQPGDLPAGGMMELSVPATGGTYRLEAERPDFAPYLSQGLAIQEGCGTLPGGGFSTGFVTGLPLLDGDIYFDRYCQETTAAYDPNDKQAIPAGVGAMNYIEPNQRMDYKIRFQNTGNDTAFNIVIIDTIDTEVLDLSTFRPGIGSHDYYAQITGNEVRFLFDDVQLVDSITNEPLSHGFVHFSIAQQPDLADGTVLSNRAGIYFDFNDPIITNYSMQTIGREILISKVTSYSPLAQSIVAYPSPTRGSLFFELSEVTGPVDFMVFDMFGRELFSSQLIGDQPSVDLSRFPAGRYGYRLLQDGQLLQTGVVTKN